LQVPGALDPRGVVGQDAQGFARANQAIGRQARVGVMQKLENFIEMGVVARMPRRRSGSLAAPANSTNLPHA
jgi:hypothetical protein